MTKQTKKLIVSANADVNASAVNEAVESIANAILDNGEASKEEAELAAEAVSDAAVTAEAKLKYDPVKLATGATKSAKIRYLHECNVSTGEIAKILGIRYQHVRNTLIYPVNTPKSVIK